MDHPFVAVNDSIILHEWGQDLAEGEKAIKLFGRHEYLCSIYPEVESDDYFQLSFSDWFRYILIKFLGSFLILSTLLFEETKWNSNLWFISATRPQVIHLGVAHTEDSLKISYSIDFLIDLIDKCIFWMAYFEQARVLSIASHKKYFCYGIEKSSVSLLVLASVLFGSTYVCQVTLCALNRNPYYFGCTESLFRAVHYQVTLTLLLWAVAFFL